MAKEASESRDHQAQPYRVTRIVSLILLIGVIAILGVIFYQVMARFLVPLFLSALLVVIFRPLHQWMLEKVKGRQQIAALLTTLAILLLVLVPVSSLIVMAAAEGSAAVKQIKAPEIIDGLSSVRSRLNLEMPNSREIRAIEWQLEALQKSTIPGTEELEEHSAGLYEIMGNALSIAETGKLRWPVSAISEDESVPGKDKRSCWQRFGNELAMTIGLHEEIERLSADSVGNGTRESAPDRKMQFHFDRQAKIHDYIDSVARTAAEFHDFKCALLGGRTRATIIETANPTREEMDGYTARIVELLRNQLLKLGGSITAFVTSTAFGAFIMVIGLYFFLLDGPKLIKSVQGLSPIEDEHEQELVEEFARVSRAVVLATLLSAVVQGLLAGIGFWFCGLESIFLLTLLSGVLAMVPFVGAASVWVSCALYLFFVDQNPWAAIGLAIYGVAIISMADNVIKPWILHGQSNLHPLLALLSVIGGVAVLGPIGILVGPMIVVFLQTLLKILQREMHLMENMKSSASEASVTDSNTETLNA